MQENKSNNKSKSVLVKKFICDGSNGDSFSPHPKVYLEIKNQKTTCLYCNRDFIFKGKNA